MFKLKAIPGEELFYDFDGGNFRVRRTASGAVIAQFLDEGQAIKYCRDLNWKFEKSHVENEAETPAELLKEVLGIITRLEIMYEDKETNKYGLIKDLIQLAITRIEEK